jgi:hypothetical protein
VFGGLIFSSRWTQVLDERKSRSVLKSDCTFSVRRLWALSIFWDVTLYNLVEVYTCFGRKYCLYHTHSKSKPSKSKQREATEAYGRNVIMESAGSSETSVTSTRLHSITSQRAVIFRIICLYNNILILINKVMSARALVIGAVISADGWICYQHSLCRHLSSLPW